MTIIGPSSVIIQTFKTNGNSAHSFEKSTPSDCRLLAIENLQIKPQGHLIKLLPES